MELRFGSFQNEVCVRARAGGARERKVVEDWVLVEVGIWVFGLVFCVRAVVALEKETVAGALVAHSAVLAADAS